MAFKPLTVNTPVGEKAHILAEDDAALYDGIFGEDCVLKLGEQFASKTISNNVIRIMDGVVVVGGHVGRIIKGDYEDMMIDNGTADQKRNDLIVARFQSGGTGGTDTYSLVVVKGTPGSTAKDPAIVQEDLYAGGKQRDYPLYRVRIENLSVVGVDKLFKVNRNFKVLAEELDKTGEKIDLVNRTLEERTNGKARIYGNAEGGNIEITSKDGIKWEIDANENHLRIYSFGSSNKYVDYHFRYDRVGGVVATVEEVSKKMDKMTVVNNATTTGSGTVLDGRMGKALNDKIDPVSTVAKENSRRLNSIEVNLNRSIKTIGSAYAVTASYYSNAYLTTVYWNGTHVGDKMAAYTQRNFGTLPPGRRPAAKCQIPVAGVPNLYLTIEPSGVVSMRNEHYAEISFAKVSVYGALTFIN